MEIEGECKMDRVLLIYSGGLDSTTCLFWALDEFEEVYTLTFFYGQKHDIEIEYSKKTLLLASELKGKRVYNKYFELDLSRVHKNALTSDDVEIPSHRDERIISSEIPSTYVAFRNGIFLSIATAFAEALNISNIAGGWNAIDYSGYPDCRGEFIRTFERAINYGTKFGATGGKFKILTPLIRMSKAEIIRFGKEHGADYSYAYSCYRGREEPCGTCDACILRAKGFREAGYEDDFLLRLKREKGI